MPIAQKIAIGTFLRVFVAVKQELRLKLIKNTKSQLLCILPKKLIANL